jgi:uncharacterized spore protein YtfJ
VEDVENLVKTTMDEIDKMVTSKKVVGDPIEVDGKTLIPLISVGFGFGAGGGSGKGTMRQSQQGTGEGSGGGSGGGAGMRPIAVIISDEKGVRIEPIKGGLASALEKMAETAIPMMMQRRNMQDQGQSQSENKEK